jgi:hypothetical protein
MFSMLDLNKDAPVHVWHRGAIRKQTGPNTGLGFGYNERFTDPLGRAFTLSAVYSIGAGE